MTSDHLQALFTVLSETDKKDEKKLTELNPDLFVHVRKMSGERKTLALDVRLACESIRFFRL